MRLNRKVIGKDRDLVLVHGWGMNGAVWEPLVNSLAADFRMTIIELPGHGTSDYEVSQNSLDEWCELLLDAAPERAVWLGWSLGGQLAMNVSLLAPERVSALILVASTPRFVWDKDWPDALSTDTIREFAEQLAADPGKTLSRFLAMQVRGGEHGGNTMKQLKRAIESQPIPAPEALENGLRLLLETDLRPSLRRFRHPSLWLLGGRDTLVPAGVARRLSNYVPGAEIHLLDKAAHAPFLSHAEVCNKLLREFVDAH